MQDGFRLIVGVVAEQQVQDARLPTPPAEKAITGDASRVLKSARWLWTQPRQDVMLDPAL
jgi:hypothetical protein